MNTPTPSLSRTDAAARCREAIRTGVPFGDQRAITAEHEAAHVVAYLATGCGFHYVEIEPYAFTRSSPDPVTRDPWTLAVVRIAGVVVEDTYRPEPLSERVADATDRLDMGEDPAELGDMDVFAKVPQLAEPAYSAAQRLLAEHAEVHAEVADALYERGHLTREDLAALPLAGVLLRECEEWEQPADSEHNNE